jgi:hypothetical protein
MINNSQQKSAPKNAPPQSKEHLLYWKRRIFRPPGTPNFFVELQYRGARHKLSLETSNLDAAASRAREMYHFVRASGWGATIAKYRPAMVQKKIDIGQLLSAQRTLPFL